MEQTRRLSPFSGPLLKEWMIYHDEEVKRASGLSSQASPNCRYGRGQEEAEKPFEDKFVAQDDNKNTWKPIMVKSPKGCG